MSRDAPPATLISRGTGEATVLLHGALSSPKSWHAPFPHRVLSGRTIAYPLPGHHPWRMDISEVTRMLDRHRLADTYARALWRDFEGQPVHIIGHSTGAFIALMLAQHYPHLVSRLTLAGGFSNGACGGSEMTKQMLAATGLANMAVLSSLALWTSSPLLFQAGLKSVMRQHGEPRGNPLFQRHWEWVRQDLVRAKFESILIFGRWVGRTNLTPSLGRITQPTLVVAGTDDPVVPFEHQRQMSSALRRGSLSAFRQTGHLPMAEMHRAFCASVDRFAAI